MSFSTDQTHLRPTAAAGMERNNRSDGALLDDLIRDCLKWEATGKNTAPIAPDEDE